jgi:hypothetical protein
MSTASRCIRFGPATVSVEAATDVESVVAALTRWLPSEAASARPDVAFTVRARRGAAPRDPLAVTWWDGKAWQAELQRRETGLEWMVSPRENGVVGATRFVPDAVIRIAHVHGFGRDEIRASALLYGHLLPAAQLALLRHEATLVHASSLVGPRGGGVLVLGWGGAAKTSASTSLYVRQPERWRSMSDDLAIVSRDGRLHRSPVPVNVFPYNTELFPELAAITAAGAGLVDRAHWRWRARLLGPSGVARRFAPFAEFQGPPTAPLAAVVELQRRDIPAPIVEPADAAAIAAEARRVLAHELARGFGPMQRLHASRDAASLPFAHPDVQLAEAEAHLIAAVARCRIARISLPLRTPPAEVGQLVERVVADVA